MPRPEGSLAGLTPPSAGALPWPRTIAPASLRLVTWSFSRMCVTWTLTVFSVMNRRLAIRRLVRPSARSSRTWHSRGQAGRCPGRGWRARARGCVAGHGSEIDPGPCAQLANLPRKSLRAERAGRSQCRLQPGARRPAPSSSVRPAPCAARAWNCRCGTGQSASTVSGAAPSRRPGRVAPPMARLAAGIWPRPVHPRSHRGRTPRRPVPPGEGTSPPRRPAPRATPCPASAQSGWPARCSGT